MKEKTKKMSDEEARDILKSVGRSVKKWWDDDMDLPKGMTCGDCEFVNSCKKMFNVNVTNIYCDYAPSKFLKAL